MKPFSNANGKGIPRVIFKVSDKDLKSLNGIMPSLQRFSALLYRRRLPPFTFWRLAALPAQAQVQKIGKRAEILGTGVNPKCLSQR